MDEMDVFKVLRGRISTSTIPRQLGKEDTVMQSKAPEPLLDLMAITHQVVFECRLSALAHSQRLITSNNTCLFCSVLCETNTIVS